MSIIKLLNKKLERALFTTPSHSQRALFSQNFESFYRHDFSEIEGFDNLADPKNAILMAQGKASDIFNTRQTYFIVQGATTALHAAMKTLIDPGDRVLIARNCHKSVYNGMVICAGMIDWFLPETDEDWGIYTKIDPVKLGSVLELNDYKVFIMTNPTYEGVNSDIERIAQVCHEHNTYLIVDEAHGALYNFSDKLPKTAIQQGADVSVNSLHKTAGALNQTALLHVSPRIKKTDITLFQKAINIFQTSSPSYPLLANIESCIAYLDSKTGRGEIAGLLNEIEKIKKELSRFGVSFYDDENHDMTKILLKKDGISGTELSQTLFDEYNIEDELCNQNACLYLTGIGTSKQKLDRLRAALKKVRTNPSYEEQKTVFQPFPMVKIHPVDMFNKEFVYVKKENALLKISNKMIIPYPPGIGLLYPGEAIQEWHLDYLSQDVEVLV